MPTYRPTLKILSRVTANKLFFKEGPNFNNFATKRTQCINNAFRILSSILTEKYQIEQTCVIFAFEYTSKCMKYRRGSVCQGHCGSQLNFNRKEKLTGTDSSRYSTKIGTTTLEQQMNRIIVHPSTAHRRW